MSFLGFDAVSTLAEEVEGGDRRVVGRAIIAVLILSAVFFVGITWVFGDLMPGIAIKDQSAAIYELAAWATGSWTAVVLAWSYATIVGLSNALPMQVGVARVVFAMGRDRQLPSVLARIHPKYRTPYVGMLVTAAISLAVALYMKNKLDDLASIVNFGALSGFLFLHVSVLGALRHPAALARLGGACAGAGMRDCRGAVGVLRNERLGHEGRDDMVAIGLLYGAILKAKKRDEIRAPI
jgi:amino acid transporter